MNKSASAHDGPSDMLYFNITDFAERVIDL